jgi:hypothetical protein
MCKRFQIFGWSVITIIICMFVQPIQTIAQESEDGIIGYMVQLSSNNIETEVVRFDTLNASQASPEWITPSVLYTRFGTIDDMALAPDKQSVAAIFRGPDSLFTLNISQREPANILSLPLPATQRPDFRYRLWWSPDSLKLAITPPTAREPTLIYDVLLRQWFPLNVERALMAGWLPDSTGFFYYGYSVCGEGCYAADDLYLATYQDGAFQSRSLTELDARTLGIPDRLNRVVLRYVAPTLQPATNRIYMTLQETEVNPDGVSFLYSMTIGNEPQLEVDLSNYYPDTQHPTRITKIIASTRDNSIYLFTSTQDAVMTPESTINRLSILSYTPEAGITEVYRLDIRLATSVDRRFNHGAFSPDGRYLAVSSLSLTAPESSDLVIIDLEQGTLISQLDNLLPMCQPFTWSPDSTRIIYGQSELERCPLVLPNQPLNQVVSYDIFTGQSNVLVEQQNSFIFLTPEG